MAKLAMLIGTLLLAVVPSGASNAVSLGYSDSTTIVGPGPDACADGFLMYHHDWTFENGYAWSYAGVAPPYYGAFGEGYDLGFGTVYCCAYWLTASYWFWDEPSDCYVWEGGAGTLPGAVLGMTSTVFLGIGYWPSVTQHHVDMNVVVTGPFTVGYWGNWPGQCAPFYCAADLDGNQGAPWTNIAPGIGYPTGWQDPSIVWGPTSSMGCGVYFWGPCSPVESETWGAIKAMFRE